MEFGKLHDISNVDFTLPKSHENNLLLLSKSAKKQATKIFVGCTGWGMPQWNGKWYPKATKSKDFLKEYSKQFNSIEHNTTHYHIPDIDTVLRWKNESSIGFKFCPKIPQTISHSPQLGLNTNEIRLFCENIAHLDEKMGCCFMQLAPNFNLDKISILEHFLQVWQKDIPLAIELRNEQIFQSSVALNQFFNLFEKYNVSSVITDVAGRRDVLHQRLSTTTAMIRFVGNDLHLTDYQRIDNWIIVLNEWINQGLENLYFFSHQPDNLFSPEMAVYFIEKLKMVFPNDLQLPKSFEEQNNIQFSLF